jgi:hypothetical protein
MEQIEVKIMFYKKKSLCIVDQERLIAEMEDIMLVSIKCTAPSLREREKEGEAGHDQ